MCDRIDTPFILGVFRPRIYLPSNMSEQDVTYVLAHEQAHIKRHDHWWKPLGFALLTIYWFHPILWIAYVLLCRDIELACDEKVIKEMGIDIKKPYSDALINCSIPRRAITACPLAFGEVGVKERVKTVLNYKKPAFWIVLIAVIACVIVAVCFLTNPKDRQDKEAGDRVTVSSSIYAGVHLPETILSQDDAKTIINILDSREWEEDTNPEMGEFSIVINENHYVYISTKGILKNYAQKKCLVLSEEDKATVGEIIDKYLFADTTKSNITKWFDFYRSDEFDWNQTLEIELPELLGVKFLWKEGKVSVVDAKGTMELIGGMAVICQNGYFYDLTKDGIPELCATVSVGSGMIDTRVVVYDYKAGITYELEDRSFYDYALFLSDEELIVNKTKYMTEYIVEQGGLAIKGTSKEAELVLVPTQSFKESFVLKSGAYLAGTEYVPPTSSGSGLYPYFYLDTARKEFYMGQSLAMSFALSGTYEFDGEKLTLSVDEEDASDVYILYLNQYGSFIYDETASTVVSEYGWLKNGMAFGLMPENSNEWDGVYHSDWLFYTGNGEQPIDENSYMLLNKILEILNTGTWTDEVPECDVLFYMEGDGFRIGYCDCGTITDTTHGCSKKLNEEDNQILQILYKKYYELMPEEIVYIEAVTIIGIEGNNITVITEDDTKETFLVKDVNGLSEGDIIIIQYNDYSAENTKVAEIIGK